MIDMKRRRGAPPKKESAIHAAGLDAIATLDEQELDELHPAEKLVQPLTSLVLQMVSESDAWRREAYGQRAMSFLHALHDHLVSADADNHQAEGCVYCLLSESGATFLDPAAMVKAELVAGRLRGGFTSLGAVYEVACRECGGKTLNVHDHLCDKCWRGGQS